LRFSIMSEPILACRNLSKSYRDGEKTVNVLTSLNFSLLAGESVAIVGRSGSGKSTLLNLLGGLDVPSSGSVSVSGREMALMTENERCDWRNQQLGFVFQFHHLLPEFTAVEAVAMPARIAGLDRDKAIEKAASLLAQVGLEERLHHRPNALSGGERQRVAIARALVNRPSCVLMDEPTGNLDPESAEQVLDLMVSLEREDTAFVVVTHDMRIAQRMNRVMTLTRGALLSS
jgi:lipoprotein-releasing system ATP-binding protein